MSDQKNEWHDNALWAASDISQKGCHLWMLSLVQPDWLIAECNRHLTMDEVQRRDRFAFTKLRQRYTIARSMLRVVLSRYVMDEPSNLHFTLGDHGKPYLCNHQLEFNLSHTAEALLIGVSKETPVGVDLECSKREVSSDMLVKSYFHEVEQARFRLIQSEAKRQAEFLRLWVCKEAYLKMRGCGLSAGLASVAISMADEKGVCEVAAAHEFKGQLVCGNAELDGQPYCYSFCTKEVPREVKKTRFGVFDRQAWRRFCLI